MFVYRPQLTMIYALSRPSVQSGLDEHIIIAMRFSSLAQNKSFKTISANRWRGRVLFMRILSSRLRNSRVLTHTLQRLQRRTRNDATITTRSRSSTAKSRLQASIAPVLNASWQMHVCQSCTRCFRYSPN